MAMIITEPSHMQTQDADAIPVPCSLKAKLALHQACDEAPLLLIYELVYVVCPTGAVLAQVVHAVADCVELLGAFIELPRGPCAPTLLCRGHLRGV